MRFPGNRLGWGLAGVLAMLFAAAAWQLASVNRLTPATSLLNDTAAFAALSPEVPASAVYRFDAPGDAAALYRKAIAAIRSDLSAYEAAAASNSAEAFEAMPAWPLLRDAAPLAGGCGLDADPAARAGYDTNFEDDLNALELAAKCMGRAAMLRLSKEPEKARALLEAQFAIGAKLFDGRVRYLEAATALAIARDATGGLREVAERAGDARHAAAAASFDRAAGGLLERRMIPIWSTVAAVDGRAVAEHAGDVYALADAKTIERMWRVEAALALGRHQFNCERLADRLIVPRRLNELERDEKDPFVLAAIRAARGLTVEQFRTLR